MFELALENNLIFQVVDDEFIKYAYHVRIKNDTKIFSSLHLVPLWVDSVQFNQGDYYQKTFTSYPKLHGYGRLLIDTLLDNRARAIPLCVNIYSTSSIDENNFDDTDKISSDADAFWESLVRRKLAERNDDIARFRMII